MQFTVISLEGVAAILSFFVAAGAFTLYRLQQRSEAAAKALVIINNFIAYIKAIGMNPWLYESRDYYPDRIPEIPFKGNEGHWVRPFRLIFNETNKFRKELGEAIIKIAGKEFGPFGKLLDKIEKLGNELSNLLPKKTEDIEHSNQMILDWMENKKLFIEKIDGIRKEAEDILLPIINGKSWCLYIVIILGILSLFVLIA